jgi:hypothetical protein
MATKLRKGTRVQHRVFPWLWGKVEAGDGRGHYKVRVDPECAHHCEFVYITPNEIERFNARA